MDELAQDACLREYEKNHCWQYDIRLRNREEDLKAAGLTEEVANTLRVSHFTFRPITSAEDKTEAVEFIKRHEWLGTLSQYTTHWFGAYYHDPDQGLVGKDILAGVCLMNLPKIKQKFMGSSKIKQKLQNLTNLTLILNQIQVRTTVKMILVE
jgi:hypothetical protein